MVWHGIMIYHDIVTTYCCHIVVREENLLNSRGLGDGLVIPKMVEFKNCEDFEDLRLPRWARAAGSRVSRLHMYFCMISYADFSKDWFRVWLVRVVCHKVGLHMGTLGSLVKRTTTEMNLWMEHTQSDRMRISRLRMNLECTYEEAVVF